MCDIEIPIGSIVGLNYSGMHDSSVAIVSPTGKVLYASSLERFSRKKQDGQFPTLLLDSVDWDKVSKVAISNSKSYAMPKNGVSLFHPVPLQKDILADRSHKKQYYDHIDTIDKEKLFFPHHKCHASSSFYGSGFENALCLVYDGGMANEHWFGGVYEASVANGIKTIDLFSTQSYSNITHLYSYITALLGFTPLKHEGKITGLAAYGNVTRELKELLNSWLCDPRKLKCLFWWEYMYEENPSVKIDKETLAKVQKEFSKFSKEDLAATVQELAEEHILKILENIKKANIQQDNICLSGGLFANVKINQRVSEAGFKNIFVAPPMSDDGTALGAAWLAVHSLNHKIEKKPFDTMYLGKANTLQSFLKTNHNLIYKKYDDVSKFIATKLSEGFICALFQGKSEFGPRALGNRSILAQATQYGINDSLNKRLNRTEFMPFAPVIRDIDMDKYFFIKEGEKLTSKFMTITLNCTKQAKKECPAVVHVDNTARPQRVEKKDNSLVYDILTKYAELTNKYALVNTSFNIHEEPIVNSYADAIKGFFESGLDYLYMDGIVVSLKDNYKLQKYYTKKKIKKKNSFIRVVENFIKKGN